VPDYGDRSFAALTATEIAARVRSKEISVREIVEHSLRVVADLNGAINAICTLCADQARAAARDLDARIARGDDPGPLAGVPVGIKDVTPVAGVRTTYGSQLYADNVASGDALVVARLKKAGAILIGKTNTPEFATGGNTFNEVFGRTRNPWNTSLTAGGSTGGGAAALASGMIALAEGTDLGGSLRIPASFCGVVGLRPSPGLVPTVPTPLPWDDMQVTGAMARSAEDLALFLQAVAGASPLAPLSQPTKGRNFVAAVKQARLDGLKIAYSADITGVGVDHSVQEVCRAAIARVAEEGARIEEIDFSLAEFRQAFQDLRGLWMVGWQDKDLHRIDRMGENLRNNVNYGLSLNARQLAAATRARGEAWHKMRGFFSRYDVLLTPTVAVPPFSADVNYPAEIGGKPAKTYVDWLVATFLVSLTGLPAASVPCGLTAERSPVGMQIVGPQFGEERVLGVARCVTEIVPIGKPPLWLRQPSWAAG
jgi:amidase